MRLLFDNNLSHKLIDLLADLYPGSSQVMLEDLDEAEDDVIWQFARDSGYVIVTKDSDYHDLSLLKGSPPKVIWLRIGNCKVLDVARIIRQYSSDIQTFLDSLDQDIIELD